MFHSATKFLTLLLLLGASGLLLTMAAGNWWAASFDSAEAGDYSFRGNVFFVTAGVLILLAVLLIIRFAKKK